MFQLLTTRNLLLAAASLCLTQGSDFQPGDKVWYTGDSKKGPVLVNIAEAKAGYYMVFPAKWDGQNTFRCPEDKLCKCASNDPQFSNCPGPNSAAENSVCPKCLEAREDAVGAALLAMKADMSKLKVGQGRRSHRPRVRKHRLKIQRKYANDEDYVGDPAITAITHPTHQDKISSREMMTLQLQKLTDLNNQMTKSAKSECTYSEPNCMGQTAPSTKDNPMCRLCIWTLKHNKENNATRLASKMGEASARSKQPLVSKAAEAQRRKVDYWELLKNAFRD